MRTLSKDEIRKFVLDYPHYYELQPNEVKIRLGKSDDISTKDIQEEFINDIYQPLTKDELILLKPFVIKANNNLKRILRPFGLDKKPIETIIIKSVDGKDWGMPYTKSNVIILPQSKIRKGAELGRTITHEKLHIYQRKYPQLFKKIYKDKLNFDVLKLNANQIKAMKEMGLDKIIINNPDTMDMGLMVYKGELLPLTVVYPNSDRPVNIVVRLKPDGIILENKGEQLRSYDKIRLDHPNEMMAYMVCK
jgi:hypothetical protein